MLNFGFQILVTAYLHEGGWGKGRNGSNMVKIDEIKPFLFNMKSQQVHMYQHNIPTDFGSQKGVY